MIVLAFGTFNSKHAANALLLGDLRRAGAEVRVCHAPLWEATRDKRRAYFAPLGLLRLALGYARAVVGLVARFPDAARGAELIVTGFNGQLDVLLARRLAGRRRILFAPLVTISETLIDDRGDYEPDSFAARLFSWLDRRSLAAADIVLLDTRAHRDWAVARLGLRPERVVVQYLGAEPIFAPAERAQREDGGGEARDLAPVGGAQRGASGGALAPPPRLRVLCYSSYLPLHGSLVVARAARLIAPDEGICFDLVGDGPDRAASDALVHELPHVWLTEWVPYEELAARIARADVVLGIFGTSQKAAMVVPNKVYQAAQVGRAIVTGDTPAIREVLVPDESVIAIAPDPEALAGALRTLAADPGRRERLGVAARLAVARLASAEVRAARLREAIGIASSGQAGVAPRGRAAVGGQEAAR